MFASPYWALSPVPKSPRTRNFREFGRLGRAVAPSPALPDDTATPPCGAVPCCDAAGTTRAMANTSEAASVHVLGIVVIGSPGQHIREEVGDDVRVCVEEDERVADEAVLQLVRE